MIFIPKVNSPLGKTSANHTPQTTFSASVFFKLIMTMENTFFDLLLVNCMKKVDLQFPTSNQVTKHKFIL